MQRFQEKYINMLSTRREKETTWEKLCKVIMQSNVWYSLLKFSGIKADAGLNE